MLNRQVKEISKFLLGEMGLPVYVAQGPIERVVEIKITSECGCVENHKYYPPPLDRFVTNTHITCGTHVDCDS